MGTKRRSTKLPALNGVVTAGSQRPKRCLARPRTLILLLFGTVLVYTLVTSFCFVYHSQNMANLTITAKEIMLTESLKRDDSPAAGPLADKKVQQLQQQEQQRISASPPTTLNSTTPKASTPKASTPTTSTPTANATYSLESLPPPETFSACLMVMDDNHRLVEWLAYHYFVMNLRYLVILPDQFSRFWPTEILNKWRKYMVIEELKDQDYMDEDHAQRAAVFLKIRNTTSRRAKQQYHMERQSNFYRYCALHLQAKNRTWVSFHDVDEYYVINSQVVNNAMERMREPGSVVVVLNQVQSIVQPLYNLTNISISEHHMSPCVTTYRLRYGAVESTPEERQQGVPAYIDPRRFETLRWRHYADPRQKLPQVGKSLLDVSKIPDLDTKHYVNRPLTPFSPHSILPMCADPYVHKNTFIRVNHYIGSWEYYSFRSNDGRKGANKNRDKWEADSAAKGGKAGDEIRAWMDGFVRRFGEQESKYLLEGSGLDANFTAVVDASWVLPGQRKYRFNQTETKEKVKAKKPKKSKQN